MSSLKKFNLDALKVESFITSIKGLKSQTLKGGTGTTLVLGGKNVDIVKLSLIVSYQKNCLGTGGNEKPKNEELPETDECDTLENTLDQCV